MKLSRQFRDKTEEYFTFDITTTISPQNANNFKVGVGGRMSLSATHRVDWGDGSDEESVSLVAASHTYTTAGTYTVKVWTREKNYNITTIEFSSGPNIDTLDLSEMREMHKVTLPTNKTVSSVVLPTQYDGNTEFELSALSCNSTFSAPTSSYSSSSFSISFAQTSLTTIDVNYTCTVDIQGFELELKTGAPTLSTVSGGDTSSWTVSSGEPNPSEYDVVGIDLAGATISAGSGTLTELTFSSDVTSWFGSGDILSEARFATITGNTGNGNLGDANGDSAGPNVTDVVTMVNGLLANRGLVGTDYIDPDGDMSGSQGIENLVGIINIILGGFSAGEYASFEDLSMTPSNVLDTTIWPGFTNIYMLGGSTNIRRIKTQSHSNPCIGGIYWYAVELDAIGPNADDPADFTWDFSNLQIERQLVVWGDFNTNPTSLILPASSFGAAGVNNVQFARTLITTLDLSNIVWQGISGQRLEFFTNLALTTITFATSPVSGTFNYVGGNANSSLAGIMDISAYELDAGSNVRFQAAAGVTNIILKASTLTTLLEIRCDHTSGIGSLQTINFTDVPNATEINSFDLLVANNNMTSAQVNQILVDLDTNSTGTFLGRTIDISGSNAAPDASAGGIDGLTAKTNLIAKSFSVTTS